MPDGIVFITFKENVMEKDFETLELVELGDAKALTKGPYVLAPKEDNGEQPFGIQP